MNAKLVMNNVTIDSCVVKGYQKVGGLVGQLLGTVELNKVKVTNTIVNGYTEVAKIAGIIGEKGSLTVTDCDFSGITVNGLNKDTVKKSDITSSEQPIVGLDSNTYDLSGTDIFGSATNDWAWFYTGNYFDVTVPAGTFEGTHYMSTTSKNVVNGVPAN